MPIGVKKRIQKSTRILEQGILRASLQPHPTALYFTSIRRGPIGVLRAALRQSLPSWALLGISFVGGIFLEIITDHQLADRFIAILEMLEITMIPNYDIYSQITKRTVPRTKPTNISRRRKMSSNKWMHALSPAETRRQINGTKKQR